MKKTSILIVTILLLLGSGGTSIAVHSEVPAETMKVDENTQGKVQAFRPSPEFFRVQALINLLIKKGVITKEELEDEILRMKQADR